MTTLLWNVFWVLFLVLMLRGVMTAVNVFLFMLATAVWLNLLMEVL